MSDTHSRIRRVDMLATRPTRPIGIDPDLGGIDFDIDIIGDFRRNERGN